jgi:Integrase core domain
VDRAAGRNLAVSFDERFEDIKFLIRDRGSNFTSSFDAVFLAAGTRILRTAVQVPRMNATCERLVGTLRREILDRILILGERHLCSVLTEYQAHYNTARPHQGIAQRVPDSEHDGGHPTVADLDRERIHRKPVLGGLINEYTRRLTPKTRRSPGGSYFRAGQVRPAMADLRRRRGRQRLRQTGTRKPCGGGGSFAGKADGITGAGSVCG